VGKSVLQTIYDLLGSPLRLVILPDHVNERLGLTSFRQERIAAVLPHIRGRLLDVGCGDNRLVKTYGEGVGVDVFDWGGGAQIVPSSAQLPFPDRSFDTATLLASLNHIPEREQTLAEIARVLKPGGRLVLTMINPLLGGLGHRLWWYSEDKTRGTLPGETDGLWNRDLVRLCRRQGFEHTLHERFVYFMNNLHVFELS
jgi:SAM-dependent methyltransferase